MIFIASVYLIATLVTGFLVNKYLNLLITESNRKFQINIERQHVLDVELPNALDKIENLSAEYQKSLLQLEVFKKELDMLKINKSFR